MLALTFPGQGSQRAGMAAAWQDQPAFARWAEADDVLGWDVTGLGLDAPADELREPANCQVALFVHHAVLLDAWRSAGGGQPAAVAGHSLGEYDALVAAGVLSFADALRLVDARATHTQAAADARPGTMVACLGYDPAAVSEACAAAGAHVANDNAPGQLVCAGSAAALDRLAALLADSGARGTVKALQVGAAYHSPHMEPALAPFGEALDVASFATATVPVVANVDAAPHRDADEWPDLLRRQVISPVRWRETIMAMAALGVTELVELAATPVLSGLAKRTEPDLARRTVATPEDLP